jgi:antitoxin (DNA-binding transcriptional repressor) of toxin-antitoxin stability system
MKSLEVDELTERINEILRMVEEEGETIEVMKRGEVIAHLVPVRKQPQPVKRDLKAFWAEMDRLAAEIGAHWKGDMDAVEAVRDVRRDL